MAKEKVIVPAFDDIVFEERNKEYGAYKLRKKYNRTVIIALLAGIIIIGTAVVTPYLNAKALENRQKRAEREVQIKMENLDQPNETVAPPPPPPPPPADVVQQQKYVPPVVVDSIKPEDVQDLMTADDAQVEIKDQEVIEVVEVKEEVQETVEEVPFVVVEEMPMFPGGDAALLKYIGEHTTYPDIAKENNITIYKDSDLAEILSCMKPGEIPENLFRVMAEILAYCYKTNEKFRDKIIKSGI